MAIDHELGRWMPGFAARTRAEQGAGLADILALSGASDVISFSGGFPDPATFPGPLLAQILGEIIAAGDPSAFQYAPTPGLPGMRAFMADRLAALEGSRPADGELLITSGAVEAMELAGKAFLDRGNTVAVESPTYLGAIMSFRGFEADVVGVPMDGDGLEVDALGEALAGGLAPKFLYTIPDHQNPAGVSLSIERRRALVELADRHGFLILEDVAYRELGFSNDRRPSLWSLAPHAVVQAGTFSKTFFPGVRLGWAAGPADVIRQMVLAKQTTDQCAGPLGQRLLEEWGRRGELDRSIARGRALYRRRWEVLSRSLQQHMPDGVTWTRPDGGFFTWLTLPGEPDTSRLAATAMDHGVAFVPGAPFYPEGQGRGRLRLAFSRVDDDAIPEGVERLASVIRSGPVPSAGH